MLSAYWRALRRLDRRMRAYQADPLNESRELRVREAIRLVNFLGANSQWRPRSVR